MIAMDPIAKPRTGDATLVLEGGVIPARGFLFSDGRHEVVSLPPSPTTIGDGDIVLAEWFGERFYTSAMDCDGRLRGHLRLASGPEIPVELSGPLRVLPSVIEASVYMRDGTIVGVDVTEDVLGMDHADFLAMSDARISAGETTAGREIRVTYGADQVERVELVAAASAFFGRFPDADDRGLIATQDVDALDYAWRVELHQRLTPAPSPGF